MANPAFLNEDSLKGNFLIPVDGGLRSDILHMHQYYAHSGAMWMSTDQNAKAILLARIAAIIAYDEALLNARKK